MILRIMGTACLNVTLNLYILDHIRKEQFIRTDSIRLTFSSLGWTVGPFFGVWLYTRHGVETAYMVSIGFAFLLLAAFWYARLTEKILLVARPVKPANPFRFIPRFVSQPRLRLAWFIAFSRSAFWGAVFIYGPLLMVTGGYGNEYGGLLVSLANALLIITFLWGRLAEKITVRRVLVMGFAGPAVLMMVAGYTGAESPLITAGLMLLSTIGAIALDAVGGAAYYRAVHTYERTAMTAVYRTYLDFSDLLPTLAYGILLGFFGIGSVFVALGILMASASYLSWRYMPRRV